MNNKYDILKGFAFGILLLFLGANIIPIAAQNGEKSSLPISGATWLYVGGSGPGNYTKIQDAIDNASDGDTVFICNDSSPYYEKIIINTSISLIGEDRNSTSIYGTGPKNNVIEVNVFNVSISELTVENNSRGAGIFAWDCIIYNTIIRNCDYGIVAGGNDIIHNNEIYACTFGIQGMSSSNIIKYNTISNNSWDGILFYIGSYNVIKHNIIQNNGGGIGFLYAEDNFVSGNVIKSNHGNGITDSVDYSGNCFSNNTIIDNGKCGFSIRGENASIIDNSICFNKEYGVIEYSYNAHIYHNNFIGNSMQAYDEGSNNSWDNGYPAGGNYWNDYNGSDDYSGPNQDIPGSDGIGDTPYNIIGYPGNFQDKYPLMHPFGSHPEFDVSGHGGMGVTITLTNKGTSNAMDVEWNVSVTGGLFGFIHLSENESIDTLGIGKSISTTLTPFGFGQLKIDVEVTASNAENQSYFGRGFLVLFMVFPTIPPLLSPE